MDFWSLEGPRRYDAKLSKPLVGKLRESSGLFYIRKRKRISIVTGKFYDTEVSREKLHAVAAE